jgi:hypothetical protein
MKFLAGHERTKTLLRQWSGGGGLIVASIYFWSAGHEVQKSQLGLMKSLLYQIFRQCPDLMPPSWLLRFDSVSAVDNKFDGWNRQELHDAVDSTVASGSLTSNFCFFVDGLDEYTDTHAGDHYVLIQYLDHLAQSSHVKICVSSRPWNVFKDRYDKHADLKFVLQDLTSKDMLKCAMGQLQEDERSRRLASREPQALLLATQIRDKAEGVFLWVSLVTRSLKRGLSERDDTKALERRLAQTPSDLKKYFRSIFKNIDDNYKDLTMRALQIAAVGLPMPLGAFQYIPQEIEDQTYAIRQEIRSDELAVDLRAKTPSAALDAEAQVSKWCRDLLEVQHHDVRRGSWLISVPEGEVPFLHRTVHDFLLSTEMQDLFLEHSVCMPSPIKAVCRMRLAYVKSLCSMTDRMHLYLEISKVVLWARMCEQLDHETPLDLLGELHRTVLTCQDHRKDDALLVSGTVLQFAVATNLLLYVEQTPDCDLLAKSGILWEALVPNFDRDGRTREASMEPTLPMIAKLLGKGCSPNDIWNDVDQQSVWHTLMRRTYEHPDSIEEDASFWSQDDEQRVVAARIVELLLEHGADPDAKFETQFRSLGETHVRSVDTRDFLMQVFHDDRPKVDALLHQARRVRSAAAGKKPGFFARFREILA